MTATWYGKLSSQSHTEYVNNYRTTMSSCERRHALTMVRWTRQSSWKLKTTLKNSPFLQYFDPLVHTIIQADACQHGLGACLLQKAWPVAYTSRSLNSAENNYVQIEKELFAIVYACEKFHHYIYGFSINVQSDYKPFESRAVARSSQLVRPDLTLSTM